MGCGALGWKEAPNGVSGLTLQNAAGYPMPLASRNLTRALPKLQRYIPCHGSQGWNYSDLHRQRRVAFGSGGFWVGWLLDRMAFGSDGFWIGWLLDPVAFGLDGFWIGWLLDPVAFGSSGFWIGWLLDKTAFGSDGT